MGAFVSKTVDLDGPTWSTKLLLLQRKSDANCAKLKNALQAKRGQRTNITPELISRTPLSDLIRSAKIATLYLQPKEVFKAISTDRPVRPIIGSRVKAVQDSMFNVGIMENDARLTVCLEINENGDEVSPSAIPTLLDLFSFVSCVLHKVIYITTTRSFHAIDR